MLHSKELLVVLLASTVGIACGFGGALQRFTENKEKAWNWVQKQIDSVLSSHEGATPCQTAEQWEGRATEWDHLLGVNNRFNITYDGTNRRKRIMEDKHAQLPGRRIYEYIMLLDEGIQYVIDHNLNICTVEELQTWRNFSIPPSSTLEDHYEIGAPGSGFMVQEWSDRINGRKKENWIGTYTDNGCWPVSEIFMERNENLTMIQSVTTKFFDVQVGIKNMSVFTPPPICNGFRQTTTPEQRPTEESQGMSLELALQIKQYLRSLGFDF